jgi:hypothetical protein
VRSRWARRFAAFNSFEPSLDSNDCHSSKKTPFLLAHLSVIHTYLQQQSARCNAYKTSQEFTEPFNTREGAHIYTKQNKRNSLSPTASPESRTHSCIKRCSDAKGMHCGMHTLQNILDSTFAIKALILPNSVTSVTRRFSPPFRMFQTLPICHRHNLTLLLIFLMQVL